MVILTNQGQIAANAFLLELQAKRKEILDAKMDTVDDTPMPTLDDIRDDIELIGVDDDGCYRNGWGCTDHSESDGVLCLAQGTDFLIV